MTDQALIDNLVRTASTFPAGSPQRSKILALLKQARPVRMTIKALPGGEWQIEGPLGPTRPLRSKRHLYVEVDRLLKVKKDLIVVGPKGSLGPYSSATGDAGPYAVLDVRGDVLKEGDDPRRLWQSAFMKITTDGTLPTAVAVRDHVIKTAYHSPPEARARLLPLAKRLVDLTAAEGDKWKKMPDGWTDESRKEFWNSLVGDVKHKVTKCIKEMKGKVDDAGAFCAALADRVEGPEWRKHAFISVPEPGDQIVGMEFDGTTPEFWFRSRKQVRLASLSGKHAAIVQSIDSLPQVGDVIRSVEATFDGNVQLTFRSGQTAFIHIDGKEAALLAEIGQGAQTSDQDPNDAFIDAASHIASDEDKMAEMIFDACLEAMSASDIEPTLRSDWPEIPAGNRSASCGCGGNCGGSCSCAQDEVIQFSVDNPDLAGAVLSPLNG